MGAVALSPQTWRPLWDWRRRELARAIGAA